MPIISLPCKNEDPLDNLIREEFNAVPVHAPRPHILPFQLYSMNARHGSLVPIGSLQSAFEFLSLPSVTSSVVAPPPDGFRTRVLNGNEAVAVAKPFLNEMLPEKSDTIAEALLEEEKVSIELAQPVTKRSVDLSYLERAMKGKSIDFTKEDYKHLSEGKSEEELYVVTTTYSTKKITIVGGETNLEIENPTPLIFAVVFHLVKLDKQGHLPETFSDSLTLKRGQFIEFDLLPDEVPEPVAVA
jgi:hypothetical protein